MKLAEYLEGIVGQHYDLVFRFALSLARTESDARDLTQHAFYILAAKGHQVRDFSKVKSWLFTTLHRAYLEMRRTEARYVDQELQEVSEEITLDSPQRSCLLDNSQVLDALCQLDDLYQKPVALFYLEDCTYREIATILHVPVGTVKSRISRGIRQLKNILISDDLNKST
jgi:RNA polymerase sigma-70 factor, ECF subfamily